jgi:Mg2+-importing ATPase
VALTLSPLATALGFTPLPLVFFAALVVMALLYLVLVEVTKKMFYAESGHDRDGQRTRGRTHRIHRRAARFSHAG